MKKFTVLILSYNSRKTIGETIKSVLEQDYKNLEMVISDDCSKDFDIKYIESFIKKHNKNNIEYRILHNEVNLGITKHLNTAYKQIKTDYVLGIAADDRLYDSHVVTNFATAFENNKKANVITSQALLCGMTFDDIRHIIISPKEAEHYKTMSVKEQYYRFCKDCFYGAGATAYKYSFLKKQGFFDERYKNIEDWPFFLKISRNGEKIYYEDFISLMHRDGGISRSKKKNAITKSYSKAIKQINFKEIFRYFYKLNIFQLISLVFYVLGRTIGKYFRKKYDLKDTFSFIVCAYKEEHNLEECVKSLLAQDVDVDVSISTSTPNDYIKSIADKYNLKLYINKNKSSHAKDFNFAFNKAKTKFVALCHQDDYYYRDFARKMVKKLNRSKKPIIGFANYNELRENKTVKRNKVLIVKRIMNFLFLLFKGSKHVRRRILSLGSSISAPTVVFNRELLPYSTIENDMKSNIDWISYIEFAEYKGDFVYVAKPLMEHRIHENSTTTKVINNKIKHDEDYQIFRMFWGEKMAKFLLKIYGSSEESNSLKK